MPSGNAVWPMASGPATWIRTSTCTISGRSATWWRASPVRLARNIGANIGPLKRVFKILLNRRLKQLCAVTADHVCTPLDLKHGLAPSHGVLEVVAHPSALDRHDFGDAYLPPGESLVQLLDQHLSGVERVGYAGLGDR